MPRDDYRLSDADLKELVNSSGHANELAWAVKDLIQAHYEIKSLQEEIDRHNSALKEYIVPAMTHAQKLLDGYESAILAVRTMIGAVIEAQTHGNICNSGKLRPMLEKILLVVSGGESQV